PGLGGDAGDDDARRDRQPGDEKSLGEEIGRQVLAQPQAIGISGGILLALGLVPGLPFLPFATLACATGGLAWAVKRSREAPKASALTAELKRGGGDGFHGDARELLPIATPVSIEVSPQLTPLIDVGEEGRDFVRRLVPRLRRQIFDELGLPLHGVRVIGRALHLQANTYSIHVNEIPVAQGMAPPDHVFIGRDAEQLVMLGIEGLPALDPETGARGLWISRAEAERSQQVVGDRAEQPQEFVARHLTQVLRERADALLGVHDVQNMLDQLDDKGYGMLVSAVVPERVSLQRLADVLRRLLREQVTIRNLPSVLEAMAEWATPQSDPIFLGECARSHLKAYLAHKFSRGTSLICGYPVDPRIEQVVRDHVNRSGAGRTLMMTPDANRAVLESMRQAVGADPATDGGFGPILLCQNDVRYFVRELAITLWPRAVVLSYQELPADQRIQPLGRVLASPALVEGLEVADAA
ncbi:MAG: FHIPEP family type III secretion protein, partial [Acidobacteriota bacterium]